MHLATTLTRPTLWAAALLLPLAAHAGTIRDDVSDQVYRDFAANSPFGEAVAVLQTVVNGQVQSATGTLVNSRQVLTAAHPFFDVSFSDFQINGQATDAVVGFGIDTPADFGSARTPAIERVDTLFVTEEIEGGGRRLVADLAVVTFTDPVSDITPAPLIRQPLPPLAANEAFLTSTIGYGIPGNGADGVTDPNGFGTKRGGTNLAFAVPGSPEFLFTRHDDPGEVPSDALDEEYTPLPGDSGSGLFVESAEGEALGIVGVTSFNVSTEEGAALGEYGTFAGFSLLAPNDAFLEDVLIPEPSALGLLVGLAGLLMGVLRARRRHAHKQTTG